jgi:hypothetical protein
MGRISALALFLVLLLSACAGGEPGASATDDGDGGTDATPTAAEETDPGDAGATPDDEGIPSGAELEARYDCIIAALGPPGGTEVGREEAGELDLGVFFETPESFESLEAFYAEAIPEAGFEILEERTNFPGVHEWRFTSGETFQPFITLEGDISGGGGGSTVGMGLLGIPPEC